MCILSTSFLFFSPDNTPFMLSSVLIFMESFLIQLLTVLMLVLVTRVLKQLHCQKAFAHRCLYFFVSGFETQLRTNQTVVPQAIYGGKIPNEQKIGRFKRSDSWSSILHKNWEYHDTVYQNKKHKRHLRWVPFIQQKVVPQERILKCHKILKTCI